MNLEQIINYIIANKEIIIVIALIGAVVTVLAEGAGEPLPRPFAGPQAAREIAIAIAQRRESHCFISLASICDIAQVDTPDVPLRLPLL